MRRHLLLPTAVAILFGLMIAVRVEGEVTIAGKEYTNKAEFVQAGRRCGTLQPNELQVARIQEGLSRFRRANVRFAERGGTINVKVKFCHIVDGDNGKVTAEQRRKQIELLNKCYEPHGIKFTYDESQVHQENNPAWLGMTIGSPQERSAKTALHADPTTVLNFYTAGPQDGTLGWATFPSELAGDPQMDGVVILFSTLPDGTQTPYNEGKTAVHEVGHWLGLFHTFQGGCTSPNDHCDDTVAHRRPNFDCPDGTQANEACTAGEKAPVKNYMNYVDDACMTEFSDDQESRMKDLIGLFRPELVSRATGELSTAAFQEVDPWANATDE